ncbi:MAG: CRISPR-associated endoribonuclease Cas6 [Stenomitos frigidus ULC029]
MPHSLVLNLLPASSIPPGYLTGKHFHALFLTLVSSVDKALGDRLHEQKTEKAFTLSPLQRSNHNRPDHTLQWDYQQPVPAQTPCWWRISLLDEALFSYLTPLWLNLNPAHPWHLGPADLHITSILGTAQFTQPWANFCPYAQLYEQASDHARQLTFRLCTPATFRQGNYDSALPTRESVFYSLLKRWNRYSGMTFPETLIDYLFPSFFDLRTELVNDPKSKWAGCVGTIGYRLLGDADTVAIKQLNTLADFALYAGIGRKTPMGMGIVRRL